jgi:5-formyltetrahydrofolate cyclo-ligase
MKESLRAYYKKLRKDLTVERKKEASAKACSFLKEFTKKEKYVLSFAPFNDEINISPFNEFLAHENRLVLPKLENQDLLIFLVASLENDLKAHPKYKMLEPIKEKCIPFATNQINVVIVPGLAFDKNNHRLGYGMGCYDRFLKKLSKNTQTLGIGYREQLSMTPLPVDEHDQPLDNIFLF